MLLRGMNIHILRGCTHKWIFRNSNHLCVTTQYNRLIRSYSNTSNNKSNTLTQSYLSNPGKWPLMGITLGQVVDRAERLYGEREAVVSVFQGIRKNYAQLKEESDHVAAGLLALGLEPGDRLGIWGPNSYEWVLTQFAAAKAGLVLVHVNPAYKPRELEYCLNKVSIKALICDKMFKTSDYYKMLCELAPELPSSPSGILKSPRLPHLQRVIVMSEEEISGTIKFTDLFVAADSSQMNNLEQVKKTRVRFDDPCSIQFTSGTTGVPKAAVLSHHMIANNAYGIGRRAEYYKTHHRICLTVPLYHCFGSVTGTVLGMLFGATCVLPSRGFEPEAVVQAVQDERLTTCYGTPTMFVDILNAQRKVQRDLSSLSTGIMAGAPCPPELVMSLINELNMKDFLVMYGMTETSPVTFECFPSDSPEVRSSTIGYPSDHIEVKIADPNGQIVPVGVAGEVCIRGYVNFLGYWGDPEKTEETIGQDRWLKTGDLGILRPDGYAQIIGRIKDMIIRGGENIYPTEVENFLTELPGVLEAQVFGVPDSRMGEEVAAWIRVVDNAALDEHSIRQLCKGKISHYKVPRYILFKEEFPTTITGKTQKHVMKEITIKELNLN
ncbi:hypothetical protein O3P69_000400 [Scylla paramamosain]|uniref:Medium-chain acyl-CoA ligase ACSF2, mitochondrial n=1 Tax=Scylla paramamosain TaxID=85552 RepID=A0AAW0UW32_SCYPA